MAVEWDQIYIVYLFTQFINHVSVEWFYGYEINWLNRTPLQIWTKSNFKFSGFKHSEFSSSKSLSIIAGQKKITQSTTANVNCAR